MKGIKSICMYYVGQKTVKMTMKELGWQKESWIKDPTCYTSRPESKNESYVAPSNTRVWTALKSLVLLHSVRRPYSTNTTGCSAYYGE